MALSIEGINPLIVTGTTSQNEAIFETTTIVEVFSLHWFKPTTQGHECIVLDGWGHVKHPFHCDDDNSSLQYPVNNHVLTFYNGIYCNKMDSGTLYVHYRELQ